METKLRRAKLSVERIFSYPVFDAVGISEFLTSHGACATSCASRAPRLCGLRRNAASGNCFERRTLLFS